ncbi:MAG: hypothetical protein R2838_13165 [Caldilineaceae bacterium]
MQHILEPGTVLRNRYEVLELVGQGGMGAVYKTRDTRLEGRICAVKEILPTLAGNVASEEELEQITEQFRTEASVLARLDHPNLPKVSDYFSVGARIPGHGLCGRPRLAGDCPGLSAAERVPQRDAGVDLGCPTAGCPGVSAQPGSRGAPPGHQAQQHQSPSTGM